MPTKILEVALKNIRSFVYQCSHESYDRNGVTETTPGDDLGDALIVVLNMLWPDCGDTMPVCVLRMLLDKIVDGTPKNISAENWIEACIIIDAWLAPLAPLTTVSFAR